MRYQKTVLATMFALIYSTAPSAEDTVYNNQGQLDREIEEIEVTGFRKLAVSSAEAKRNASQVLDSISATDIGKFPDTNIGESLQRIPGIQIQRSRGEASSMAIRGLDEVATLLNGRNYFGGGTGSSVRRFASLEDIPPVIVSSIDVYKSPSADQIEGGIGGLVDIKRRRASDIDEFTFATSFEMQHGKLIDEWSPKGSIMTGNVWDLNDSGELSAIIAVSHQSREFREDQARARSQTSVSGDVNGVQVPEGALRNTAWVATPVWADRERTVVTGSVEWEPNENTRFYLEGGYTDYSDVQNLYNLGLSAYGNITDIDASNVTASDPFVNSVSYDDVRFDVLSMIDSRETVTYDYAIGFEHVTGNFEYRGEISVMDTDSDGAFRNMRLRDNWDNIPVTIDHSSYNSAPTRFELDPSFDPADPDNFNIVQWRHTSRQFGASENAGRFDVVYNIDQSAFSSVEAGVRYADLELFQLSQDQIARDFGSELQIFLGGDPLGMIGQNPFDDLFGSVSGARFPAHYVTVAPQDLIDRDAEIRAQYGFPSQDSVQSPINIFNYREETTALYVKANLDTEIGNMPLSGNVGVRYVQTDNQTDGFFQSGADEFGNAVFSPLDRSIKYTEVLPSLNLKLDVTDDVVVRAAASRTMARPHFGDLAPALGLNFADSVGSGGNPRLKPFTATNYDIGVEYYFAEASYVSAVAFYKEVDGFLQTSEELENIGGQDFLIQRKTNGGSGTVEGIELGYQQMLDFLPIKGFGLQINYTHVNSDVPSPNPELPNISLEGLSDDSYNLVAFYENDRFSGRLAYNYRSEYLVTTEYEHIDYGQLDASLSYQLTDRLSLTFDGINLTESESRDYSVENSAIPRFWFATERRLLLGVSYSL